MTNPADVLTDAFIERVAEEASRRSYAYGLTRTSYKTETEFNLQAIKSAVAAALREEREPIHEITWLVRAPSRSEAITKLLDAIRQDRVYASSAIISPKELP